MLAEGHNRSFSALVKTVDTGSWGPMGASYTVVRFFHLTTVLGVMEYLAASAFMLS